MNAAAASGMGMVSVFSEVNKEVGGLHHFPGLSQQRQRTRAEFCSQYSRSPAFPARMVPMGP